MVGQRSDSVMQYAHLGLGERRDALDNGSNFQSHVPSLNQALGHTHAHIGSTFSRGHGDYRISPSPPVHQQQNGQASQQMSYGVPATSQLKRKNLVDGLLSQSNNKRRKDSEDTDPFDDLGGQGAKHWTDEEKSKLFKWLMGPGQDEHWNSLRATKNSCLRECANEVFGGKKTYQALKGCYERNFNLFKQIYTFETFHGATGSLEISPNISESEALREYERRLSSARKAACDVGNITARTIDQWHRNGWYALFYKRWNGDPATTRPATANSRIIHGRADTSGGGTHDDTDDNDDHALDFSESLTTNDRSMSFMNPSGMHAPPISPHTNVHSMSTQHASPTIQSTTVDASSSLANTLLGSSNSSSLLTSALNPAAIHSSLHTASPSFSNTSTLSSSNTTSSSLANPPSSSSGSPSVSDQTVVNLSITQSMVASYLQYLQVQTQASKMKLEYMRKREEREERESQQRRELEKLKIDRERAEFDHKQNSASMKQKADRAIELLGNPAVDASTKQTASDFLKRLFASD
ncbi:hypothetical protein BDP27DRAFT_1339625 [Rhodocollybia butyracea]|uniref:Uncharacterized protein n=1 Tax=Rhodocollybia butyracea TaxID=206335 RepID=A0A9P5P8Y9_9AGAR|nr:hypothetical protein BDP27DRAFT_1339625 [Rhodocollybia butyracea]